MSGELDSKHGEGLTGARGAREIEKEKNWYKQLNKHQLDTLNEHMQKPFDAKFIWSSFLSLASNEQQYAPDNIKYNASSFNSIYPNNNPPREFIQPTTYTEWAQKYPYAEFCPTNWSYFRQLHLGQIPNSFGGSRRSLQKSRFKKRKSRKYKSIKKSKKSSFRKRSGKY